MNLATIEINIYYTNVCYYDNIVLGVRPGYATNADWHLG